MTPKILKQRLNETEFFIVDVETTGLSVDRGDRVCEIGAVKLHGGAVINTFGTLINPRRPITAGAYKVNGISPQMVAEAPTFPEIAKRLRKMMNGSILVAYNAPFDVSFLANEFRLSGVTPFTNPILDALILARHLLPGLGRYPQENVAKAIGIPFPVKHRALEDALVTTQMFLTFLSVLRAYDFQHINDFFRSDLMKQLQAKRIDVLQNALAARNQLWIKYLSPAKAELTERIVTPKQITPHDSKKKGPDTAMHLIAYCHSAKAERNFRIDRILDMKVVE